MDVEGGLGSVSGACGWLVGRLTVRILLVARRRAGLGLVVLRVVLRVGLQLELQLELRG